MSVIAIVTDSSACLPTDVIQRYGITVVPLALLFGGEVYRDGELAPDEFYTRLRDPAQEATTAAPGPGEFLDAFRRAAAEGASAVLCLTLSSRYSGVHSSAVNAGHLAARELAGLPIRVVDTGGIAASHGFAVLAAARAAAGGASLDEAAAAAQRAGSQAGLVGMLDTTHYLAKSGRIPWVIHFAASLLHIKPVIAASGGKVRAIGRVRSIDRGMERIIAFLRRAAFESDSPLRVAIMHADAPERARELADRVREDLAPQELFMTSFTTAMAVHTGPGFIGLAWEPITPAPQAAHPETRRSPLAKHDAAILERSLGPLPAAVEWPHLIVLSGLPGSGKSHLARELSRRHPVAVLESDALRKALFERPSYSQKENTRLFAAVHLLLEDLLRRGIPALVDATNLREVHRRPLYGIAEWIDARLLLVEVRAPEDVARRRIASRVAARNPWDRSDATIDVYETMRREAEPIERHHLVVDAAGDVTEAVEAIMRELEDVRV